MYLSDGYDSNKDKEIRRIYLQICLKIIDFIIHNILNTKNESWNACTDFVVQDYLFRVFIIEMHT